MTVKSVDEEKRVIEGIASTPSTDRMGDIVELDGMEMSLPMPFLYQHRHDQPIGQVVSAKKTKDGLLIKAQIAASGVADYIDKAWALIKGGLVPGLSIGFRSLEDAWMKDSGGIHFIRTELFEISAVTIPANAEASITAIKAFSDAQLNALTRKTVNPPGVPGLTPRNTKLTIRENIAQFESKRAAHAARVDALIDLSANEGRTFTAEEETEHDGLAAEIKQIDAHLIRLRDQEKRLAATAAPITPEVGKEPAAASAARAATPSPIVVNDLTPKGLGFARAAIALMACKGNRYEAAEGAKKAWPDMGEALAGIIHHKAEQLPGTTTGTTWANPLIQSSARLVGEFIDQLRPLTIIGRIPNLRYVPFNITVPVQSSGGTYQWVGENVAKPVSGLSLTTAVLRWAKVSGIIPFTKEAMRFSDPSIEMVVRNDMLAGTSRYLDTQFVDPAVHESTNVSPASITDQIVNTAASGLTAALFIDDMTNIIGKMLTNNQNPADLVILMSTGVALNLSSKRTSLGAKYFPEITVNGGSYNGIPIITSQNVGARIILLNPNQILIAQDPNVTIDVSEEASVIMTTTPASSPAASQLVSFWQNNLIGLRVEQFVTWKRGLTAAVEYISSASYSGTT